MSEPSLSLPLAPELVAAIVEQVAEAVAERLPNRPEPYLDVRGAANYLACPPSRIYDLVERRRVRVHRDGRRLLFRREDLDVVLVKDEPR